jgi:hypothetical protein
MSKNQLQNLMELDGKTLPLYETQSPVGHHQDGPWFQTTVTLFDGTKLRSDLHLNGPDSEDQAAERAVNALFRRQSLQDPESAVCGPADVYEIAHRYNALGYEERKTITKVIRGLN